MSTGAGFLPSTVPNLMTDACLHYVYRSEWKANMKKTKAGAHDAMTRIDVAGAEPAPKYLRSASKNTAVAAFGQIWGFWFQHVS